jgi:hypothetical protein
VNSFAAVFRAAALFEGCLPSQQPTPPQAKDWDDRRSGLDILAWISQSKVEAHFLYTFDTLMLS